MIAGWGTPHTARARSYEVFGTVNPRFSAAGDVERAKRKVAGMSAGLSA